MPSGNTSLCLKRYAREIASRHMLKLFIYGSLGAVTKLTIQIALDGFLRSRKKTQPYRGAARPVDERLAPTGAKRRPARLSDEEIGKPNKQDV